MICPHCKGDFSPKVSFQKYCKTGCQNAAARIRWIEAHGGRKNIPVLRRQDFSVGKRFSVVKFGAKRRRLSFELTKHVFEQLVSQPCFWCGGLLPKTGGGVDRVDNSVGYTLANSVPCCVQCNKAKNTYSKESFLEWVRRVYEKHLERKCPTR